jgi:drug/metabolite transporter (DMT)-like permease
MIAARTQLAPDPWWLLVMPGRFVAVPSVTAFMAFFLFGETLAPGAIAGMTATVAGVALVNRG